MDTSDVGLVRGDHRGHFPVSSAYADAVTTAASLFGPGLMLVLVDYTATEGFKLPTARAPASDSHTQDLGCFFGDTKRGSALLGAYIAHLEGNFSSIIHLRINKTDKFLRTTWQCTYPQSLRTLGLGLDQFRDLLEAEHTFDGQIDILCERVHTALAFCAQLDHASQPERFGRAR
ncbi:hypothetical protein BDN67DRAFT_966252 [Paxillus ammoniavirescens]|nr:hypothetical protein BDN67DRAFT_966252 [Paxillus ammoniavirescens]